MNVVTAILSNNEEEFNKLVDTVDINFTSNGFTLLWIAINGGAIRPQTVKMEFANFNIVLTLLEKGANPNKKCVLMTTLYSAVFHGRPDIVRLLLLYGANPNEFSLIKCFNRKYMLYGTPLNLAIKGTNTEIIKILLLHRLLYNKVTIEKTQYDIHKINKDFSTSPNYEIYKKLKNILDLLKSNYDDSYEDKAKELIDSNPKIGVYNNYYSCFQKITQVQ